VNDTNPFTDRNLHKDEATIEKTLRYLKLNDPGNANREYAVGLLKFMERFAFHAEKENDFNYDEFLDKYKASQQ
jgi:hypothetical protein